MVLLVLWAYGEGLCVVVLYSCWSHALGCPGSSFSMAVAHTLGAYSSLEAGKLLSTTDASSESDV